jgi:hypothetical protein
MDGVDGIKDFEEDSLDGTEIGLIDRIELLDKDSLSSRLLGSLVILGGKNGSE